MGKMGQSSIGSLILRWKLDLPDNNDFWNAPYEQ